MKKSLKILLIIGAVIVFLILTIAIAVPPFAKHYIEKHDRELVGRTVRMKKLQFNLFSGRLRVTGLEIGGAEDSAAFFRLDSFDMRMRLWPLLARRIDVRHVAFAEPDLKVYQHGTAFDFDDMLAHFRGDTTQTISADAASEPWEIGIYNIAIRHGHIFYKDLLLDATWGLNDVNLRIPGVYFSGAKTDVGAVLNFAEGGSLATTVAYDIATSAFDIGLRLQDFTLAGTLPYFRQSLDVAGIDGRLTADVNLHGDAEHLLSLRADGEASLAGFALRDMQQRPAISVDTLYLKLAEGDLGKQRFRFDRFYVAGFSALAEFTDRGNNLLALLRQQTTEAAEPVVTAQPNASKSGTQSGDVPGSVAPAAATSTDVVPELIPVLQIADFEIARSSIVLRDLTLEKPFEYHITDIRMQSRDFDPAKSNRLIVDARMQKTGAAKLRWEGRLDDIANQNITLWLTNIGLSDFSPYCEHYTAYPLTQGNLTFRSQNIIRNRHLDGTNHLDIFEPVAAKKRKDLQPEFKIPLKLGLYVLKDKKGHVKMDLPVKGSLDSPEFSYRKIVMKAIGNVLLKVVTAPFSFLGGRSDNLEYVAVDPRQYAFTSEQYAAFDKIAGMLRDKPEMRIDLTHRINLRKALPEQQADVLRMAYAAHLKSADTTAGSSRLSMLEYEKIQQADIRAPEIMAFADSLLALRGIPSQGLSAEKKAAALYAETAADQLRKLMETRDKVLAEYMLSTHGITEHAFRIRTPDSAALRSYAGRDRYTLALEVDGETVEIAVSDSTVTDSITTSGIPARQLVPDTNGSVTDDAPLPEEAEAATGSSGSREMALQ